MPPMGHRRAIHCLKDGGATMKHEHTHVPSIARGRFLEGCRDVSLVHSELKIKLRL